MYSISRIWCDGDSNVHESIMGISEDVQTLMHFAELDVRKQKEHARHLADGEVPGEAEVFFDDEIVPVDPKWCDSRNLFRIESITPIVQGDIDATHKCIDEMLRPHPMVSGSIVNGVRIIGTWYDIPLGGPVSYRYNIDGRYGDPTTTNREWKPD